MAYPEIGILLIIVACFALVPGSLPVTLFECPVLFTHHLSGITGGLGRSKFLMGTAGRCHKYQYQKRYDESKHCLQIKCYFYTEELYNISQNKKIIFDGTNTCL